MSQKYPKSSRLLRRKDFLRVNRFGKRVVGKWMVIDVLPRPSHPTRFGVTVTKKFGKAHDRVRFKRMAREAFRLSRHLLPEEIDLNVRPRFSAHQATALQLEHEMKRLMESWKNNPSQESSSSRASLQPLAQG